MREAGAREGQGGWHGVTPKISKEIVDFQGQNLVL